MKFKVGDKVILNLKTKKHGHQGINLDRHDNVCIVRHIYKKGDLDIKDGEYIWSIYPEMISPVERQMVFDFMKEE